MENRKSKIENWKLALCCLLLPLTVSASFFSGSLMKSLSRDTDKGVVAQWPMSSATLKSPSEGLLGGSYTFDGVDDLIDTGSDFIGTKAVTVTGWIYPTGYGENTYGRIITNNSFNLFIYNTKFLIGSTGGSVSGNSIANSVLLNKWQFIAGTRETDGTVNIYLGDLNTTPTLSGNADQASGTPVAGISNVIIGNTLTGTRTFDGSMYDLQFHEGILTTDQITDIYNHKSVSPETLLAHYKMDEGAGTTAFDASKKYEYGPELVTNAGSGAQTDWVDSNSDGIPDGWNQGVQEGPPSIVTGNGFTGNAYRLVAGTTPNAYIAMEAFTIEAGKTYALSLKHRNSHDLSSGTGAYNYESIPTNTGDAQTFATTFTASANSRLQFYVGANGTNWAELDDISLREIHEPHPGTITNATLSTFHSTQDNYSFWNDVGYGTTSGNTLSNGDFELGTTGWSSALNTTLSHELDDPLGGEGSLKTSFLGGGVGYFILGQEDVFETEKTYRVRLDLKVTNTTDDRTVTLYRGVSATGTEVDNIETTVFAGSVWHHIDTTFTTTATSPTSDDFALEITGATTVTDLLLDNVSIVEVGDDGRYPALSGSTSEDLWGNALTADQGTTTIARTRPSVPSATFDGTDDRINLSSIAPNVTDAMTVSGWFKTDNASLRQGIYSEYKFGANIVLRLSGGKISTYFFTNGTSPSWTDARTVPLNADQWYFVTAVYDGAHFDLYLDGEATADAGTIVATGNVQRIDYTTTIGAYEGTVDNFSAFFNGSLADIRVYNRALSSGEITDIYQSGTVITDGLVAHWPLSEGAGSVVYDTTTATDGNNGTIVNADLSTFWGSTQNSIPTNYNFVRGTGEEEAAEIVATPNLVGRWELDSAHQVYGSDMVTNSDFETDTSNWTEYNTPTTFERNTTTPIAGTGDLHFVGNAADYSAAVANGISFTSGKTYKRSFTYRRVGTNPVYFKIGTTVSVTSASLGGTGDISLTATTNTLYEDTFIPTETTTGYLMFRDTNTSAGEIYVDDVSITEIQATDSSVNAHTGIYYGGTTLTTGHNGETDGALVFDGTDDYVAINEELLSVAEIRATGVTYSAWVKTNTNTVAQKIFGQKQHDGYSNYSSGGIGISSSGYANMIAFDDEGSYKYSTGSTVLQNDTWYFVTGTYDSTDQNIRLYLNGALEGPPTAITTFSRLAPNESNGIGFNPHTVTAVRQYFNGSIDDTRIYDRALSLEEIQQLYNEGTVHVPGLADDSGFDSRGTPLDRVANINPPTVTPLIDSMISGSPAATFDGVADQIPISSFTRSLPSYTVSMWLNPARVTGDVNPFFWALSSSTHPRFRFFNSNCEVRYRDSSGSYANYNLYSAATVDTWTHLTATFDGETGTLIGYKNGVLGTTNENLTPWANFSGPITIGKDGANNLYFDGSIADVRIWDRPLAQAEITDLATNGSPINEGLVSWWPLSEGAGADIYDVADPGVGDDVVTNGDFETDSDWTKGTGWTIANGVANSDGTQTGSSYLSQFVVEMGTPYEITYILSSVSAGNVKATVSGVEGTYHSSVGTYTEILTPSGSTDAFAIKADVDFIGSIDNITVRPVNAPNHGTATFGTGGNDTFWGTTQDFYHYNDKMGFSRDRSELVTNGGFDTDTDWSLPTGATISDGLLNLNIAEYFTVAQIEALTIGKLYKFKYTISNYVSGGIRLQLGTGHTDIVRTANGTYAAEGIATTTSNLIISSSSNPFVGSIDNVSIVETSKIPARQLSSVDATGTALSGGGQKVADIGGSELHGTLHGGVTLGYDQKGVAGGAMVFDGVDDYVEIPDSEDIRLNGDFSLSFWFKKNGDASTAGYPGILSKGAADTPGSGGYMIFHTSNTVFFKRDNFQSTTWPGSLTDFEYNHHTITSRGSTQNLYLNGTLVDTESITYATNTNTDPLVFGKQGIRFEKGNLSDVQIYNRALSPWEVEKLYNENKE